MPRQVLWASRILYIDAALFGLGTVILAASGAAAAAAGAAVLTAIDVLAARLLLLRRRWVHRSMLGYALLRVGVVVLAMAVPGSGVGPGLIPVALLALLLQPSVRRWFGMSEEALRLTAIDERQRQRARRHLVSEAPSVAEITERMRRARPDGRTRGDTATQEPGPTI